MTKKGLFFARGQYPLGSSALRLRMWHKGLEQHGIETDILINYPSPTIFDLKNSEEFVHFSLSPNKNNSFIQKIFTKIIGTYKGYQYVKRHSHELDFVFLYGLGLLEGFLLMYLSKKYNMKFYAERCDENRQQYSLHKLTLVEHLALMNDKLFDKFILPQVNCFFVVSEYLEKKYRAKYSNIKIKRSVPSYINLGEFAIFQKNNIYNIQNRDLSVMKGKKIKFVFAGSCVFTNGIEFFLKNISELNDLKNKFHIILIFFKGDIEYIKKVIKKYDLKENVTIIENLLYKYIPAVYDKADVLVLPEMGDVVANAGFPGKTAEYLASGKAIISTDFSNLKDYLHHNENVLMSAIGDNESYQNNLRRLILDSDLREYLGKNGIITAQNFFDFKNGVLPLVEEL